MHESDTTALAGQWVVAHRVGEQVQGPIDSQRTDAAGRFRFSVPRPDSGDVIVVSSRHQGIGYFSEPVRAGPGAVPPPLVFAVFDTSVTGPALRVGIRHVVITRAEGGARRVLDVFQVDNPGRSTRVGRDSTVPVWTARLPEGIQSPEPGESDLPASVIRFDDGLVQVAAPFPPGLKQVVVTYVLPPAARRLEVPIDQPTERIEVLIEDSTANAGGVLLPDDPVVIEGRTFRRYAADSLPAGAAPVVNFSGAAQAPRNQTWLVVLVAGLTLAGAGAIALWRGGRAVPQAAASPPSATSKPAAAAARDPSLAGESVERLTAMIAALDDRFAGREGDTPAAAWQTYQRRRDDLKRELAQRVARGPHR